VRQRCSPFWGILDQRKNFNKFAMSDDFVQATLRQWGMENLLQRFAGMLFE